MDTSPAEHSSDIVWWEGRERRGGGGGEGRGGKRKDRGECEEGRCEGGREKGEGTSCLSIMYRVIQSSSCSVANDIHEPVSAWWHQLDV